MFAKIGTEKDEGLMQAKANETALHRKVSVKKSERGIWEIVFYFDSPEGNSQNNPWVKNSKANEKLTEVSAQKYALALAVLFIFICHERHELHEKKGRVSAI